MRLRGFIFVIFGVALSGHVAAGTSANPCAVLLTTRVFWIPQFGHGKDALGNRFDSVVRIINLEEGESRATVVTCSNSGQPLPMLRRDGAGPQGAASTFELDVTLAGRGTANLPSLSLNPEDELVVGYALVKTTDALGVEVLFNLRRDDGFLTSTNVRVGIIVTEGSFFADIGPEANTGVAVLLPRDADDPVPDVTVDFFLLDLSGQIQAQGQEVLREGEKIAKFARKLFSPQQMATAGIEEPFSGSIEIRTSGDPCDPQSEEPKPCWLAVMPIRQEGLVLTTQLLFPPKQTLGFEVSQTEKVPQTSADNLCEASGLPQGPNRRFFVAQFGHGRDSLGNTLDGIVKVMNFQEQEAQFELVSCSDEGEPLPLLVGQGSNQELTSVSHLISPIPGLGTREVVSLNESPDTSLDTGYLVLRSNDFVGVEVIFNIHDPQGFLTSTNVGIPPAVTATAFFADLATPVNTGVAFLYPYDFAETFETTVELFLIDEQGQIVANTEFTLNRGHKSARVLTRLFEDALAEGHFAEPFTGTIEVRAREPIAILPLRQEGVVLTTQNLFPPRVIRE